MRSAGAGFAVVVIALGIVGLLDHDYLPLWQLPDDAPGRGLLACLCSLVSIASGVGLLWRRTAALAAHVLFAYLVAWTVVFRGHDLVDGPTEFGSWDGLAEAAVIVAAAWVLLAWRATAWDRRWLGFVVGDHGVYRARGVYGVSMISFGVAHFLYLDRTVSMVPGWLPAHLALACFTGGAFIAAGVAIGVGIRARLAATLSALQMTIFTAVVWISIAESRPLDPGEWIEVGSSAALTAAGWVIAASFGRV